MRRVATTLRDGQQAEFRRDVRHVSDGGPINEKLGEGNWMCRVTPSMETQIASFK